MNLLKNLFSKPLSTQLKITSSNGFHLRPVARFSTLAKSFSCEITASFQGKRIDATKVNALLSLSLEKEDTFTLTTQGKEAKQALDALQILFETLMHDDIEVEKIQKETVHYLGNILEGDIIAKGVAIAPATIYQTETITHDTGLAFKEAVIKVLNDLEHRHSTEKNSNNADIYLAQKALLSTLTQKCDTIECLETTVTKESHTLQGTKLSAKIVDYQDILKQVKKYLGIEIKPLFPTYDFILLADDLLPSDIAQLAHTSVQGVILKETSMNSHTAILLRASGIASLIADTALVPLNKEIILDSIAGVVVLSPEKNDIEKATLFKTENQIQKSHAASKRFEPAITNKGQHITVVANVGDVASAKLAKEEGAEGIGLLRTEFLFTSVKPTLETQTNAYSQIFELFDNITIRTLDVGGDKSLPYINMIQENNPFLGIRGVRLFNTHPVILAEQLHAIFLAAKNKPIKIMFPMVSTVDEFTKAKSFAQDIANKHALDISLIDFGIMIEVPSTLFLMEAFNEVVDFYSIGTNDHTQYLFAIERTQPTLKTDALSPVVFSALETIVNKATKPVSICGELAANSDAIEKLINLGLTTLSVSPKNIAQTKEIIRHV